MHQQKICSTGYSSPVNKYLELPVITQHNFPVTYELCTKGSAQVLKRKTPLHDFQKANIHSVEKTLHYIDFFRCVTQQYRQLLRLRSVSKRLICMEHW
jgi:hypothetical protein